MNSSVLVRISAVLTFIFLAGHTFAILGTSVGSTQHHAVFDRMQAFRFEIMGSLRTHWDFYHGLQLLLIANLLVLFWLLWQVGSLVRTHPELARPFLTSFFLLYVVFAILCWTYFFIAPALIITFAAICLGMAVLSLSQQAR